MQSRSSGFTTLTKAIVLGLATSLSAGCAAEADDGAQVDDEALAEQDLTAAEPIGAEPAGKPTQNAIVLVHGNGATPTHWSMLGVREALLADGHVVQESHVPLGTAEMRAEHLGPAVDAALAFCKTSGRCNPSKVNILAHSMGGLDARVLGAMPGYKDKIASLTTIATPHQGSSVADVLLKTTNDAVRSLLTKFVERWSAEFQPAGSPPIDAKGIWKSLSVANAQEFNQRYPLNPSVFNQSWAGVSYPLAWASDDARKTAREACENKVLSSRGRVDWTDKLLVGGHTILAGISREPNDGMVTVRSAKWGTFNGCIPADHVDQIGRFAEGHKDKRTGFDHLRFFRNVAFDLASKGF
jgi:triacylglycerol lipase